MAHHPIRYRIRRNMSRPADDGRAAEASFEACPFHSAEGGIARIGPRIDPCAVIGRPDDDSVFVDARIADRLQYLSGVIVQLHQRVEVVAASLCFAFEARRGIVGVVHFHEADVEEEGLFVVGMFFDVLDPSSRIWSSTTAKSSYPKLLLHHLRCLSGLSCPLAQVDFAPCLHKCLVVNRKIRLQREVVIRVDACIVGEHVAHFVKAVLCREVFRLIAQVPFFPTALFGSQVL